MLKFAAAQTCRKKKTDHIPFLWLAYNEDLLIFPIIEHPYLRRVLIEHLDIPAGVRQIIMFAQPAAEAFQGGKMCVGRPVGIFFKDVLDITFYVFGFEIVTANRGKDGKSFYDHLVMNLCARLIATIITEPSDDCFCEEHPCSPL